MSMLSLNPTTATPSPASTRAWNSSALTAGSCGMGSPVGTAPTMATPASGRCSSTEPSVARATAMSGAGN